MILVAKIVLGTNSDEDAEDFLAFMALLCGTFAVVRVVIEFVI